VEKVKGADSEICRGVGGESGGVDARRDGGRHEGGERRIVLKVPGPEAEGPLTSER
jgi:hypothetical protein